MVQLEDKHERFLGSRDRIGSFEVCLVLDHLFNVPCKILNISSGSQLKNQVAVLIKIFDHFGSPIMMGGDVDASSKGFQFISLFSSNFFSSSVPNLLFLLDCSKQ